MGVPEPVEAAETPAAAAPGAGRIDAEGARLFGVAVHALLEAVGRASLVAEDHIPVRLAMHSGGVELSVIRQFLRHYPGGGAGSA